MILQLDPDLARAVQRIADHNGISRTKYAQNLLELGLQTDLGQAGFTPTEVRQYLERLREGAVDESLR
jgi:hypothetical protein